jgi:hypothetical protein
MIPKGQALLGTSITELRGYWTRPTCISDIDLHRVSSYEISANRTRYISEDGIRTVLLYSEFCEGLLVNIRDVNGNFFREFADYL